MPRPRNPPVAIKEDGSAPHEELPKRWAGRLRQIADRLLRTKHFERKRGTDAGLF